MKFDCIVANPPFSVKWNPDELASDERFSCSPVLPPPSKADWAFMLHILHHLADDGIAVVLEFPGILYRGQREGKVRKWFVQNNYIDRVVHVPGNTFEDTSISTCIVVLKKNRDTTDIVFEDKERTETVSIERIEENDYSLSVSLYIEEEIEKEEIDPACFGKRSKKVISDKIKKGTGFDKMVCEMEGISMKPFINSIRAILREYDTKRIKREDENQLSIFDIGA